MGYSSRAILEMKEFATFSAGAQRYVRRSLDVAHERRDVVDLWARSAQEAAEIRRQMHVYDELPAIRSLIPEVSDNGVVSSLFARLIPFSVHDLSQGKISTFAAYRFLYERLLGTEVRPWLPSVFLSAAALPVLHPEQRRQLLTSISEAAATASGWSSREVCFYPTWVEKVETAAA